MQTDNNATIKIPSDRMRRTLGSLEASGKINAEQSQEIRWLYVHARVNRWTYEQAAAILATTPAEALNLFSGRLSGGYSDCVERIIEFHDRTDAAKSNEHVETPTFHKIDDFCFAARSMRSPGFIISASHIGKTENLMEVQRRDKTNSTLIIRCPAAPTLLAVYAEIARAIHLPYRTKDIIGLRYRILDALDDYSLVVFDELHQAFLGTKRDTAIKIIESLRSLFDYKALEGRKVGMVFAGTTVIEDEMSNKGRMNLNLILDQFRRRGILKLVLPPVPPIEDAYAFAKAFNLPHPTGDALELVRYMLRDSGIGQYIFYLRSAKIMADGESAKLTWDHYLAAYDLIDQMSWHNPEQNIVIVKRNKRR